MAMNEPRYAFWPGCVSKGACRELYASTMILAQKLGIEIVELPTNTCTGAGIISEREPKMAYAINARNLACAEKTGLPMLTQCSTCQGVLSKTNYDFQKDPKLLEDANKAIRPEGYEYSGKHAVKHFLWMLVEDYGVERLKKKVVRPLRGLRVAPFYGCYLLRPSSVLGFEDANNPQSMEKIIRALGAEPIDYAGKTKCCGFPISMMNNRASLRMAGTHLLDAKKNGANVVCTPCPLCHLNLDSRQPNAEHCMKQEIKLPILHLNQLIALGLGIDPKELKLQTHIVDTKAVIKALG